MSGQLNDVLRVKHLALSKHALELAMIHPGVTAGHQQDDPTITQPKDQCLGYASGFHPVGLGSKCDGCRADFQFDDSQVQLMGNEEFTYGLQAHRVWSGSKQDIQSILTGMKKRSFPLSNAYRLLEPGPVVLLTTFHKGRANVMTLSWHLMMEFEPPLIGCVVSNRDFSFDALRLTRECVVNIPTVTLASQVVQCGNSTGRVMDKFKATGLTPSPAKFVSAPLVSECYANLECRVVDTRLMNRYNFFVLEVVQAWIAPEVKDPQTLHHAGQGVFRIAGQTITLPSKMK